MNYNILRVLLISVLIFVLNLNGICQTEMPDVLQKGSLNEQLNYIEERTRIYEYYRAVREDMFQQIKKNSLDSLTKYKLETEKLITDKNNLNLKIDSAGRLVTEARAKLDEAVRTKNNIKALGLNVNKVAYNSFMWILVAAMATALVILFLALKRNLAVSKNTKQDLEELKTEFEAYRKQSREAREKMSMDHFNAIRRLKAQIELPGLSNDLRNQAEGELTEDKISQSGDEIPGSGNEELSAHESSGASSTSEVLTKEAAKEEGSERREEGSEDVPYDEIKKPRKRGRRSSGQSGQGSIEL